MIGARRTTAVVGGVFLGVAAMLWAAAASGPENDGATGVALRQVQVAPVERLTAGREVGFPGVTRAARRAALAFPVAARLAERPVEVGERVRAGQLVARLDSEEWRLAERSAEAALAELDVRQRQAERDAERAARLAEARAATAEEVELASAAADAARAAHEAASARLADARRRLRDAALRAPFDATVVAVHLEPGEWARSGAAVVELAGDGPLEVRVEVPETVVAGLAVGDAARVELPLTGGRLGGRIASLADAAGGPGSLFPVVVALDAAEGVIAGQAAEVVVTLDRTAELAVPLAAVLDSGSSRPAVFRIADGVARRVVVRPGRLVGDRLTLAGDALAEGDLVAVVGQTALADGDPVEVRP